MKNTKICSAFVIDTYAIVSTLDKTQILIKVMDQNTFITYQGSFVCKNGQTLNSFNQFYAKINKCFELNEKMSFSKDDNLIIEPNVLVGFDNVNNSLILSFIPINNINDNYFSIKLYKMRPHSNVKRILKERAAIERQKEIDERIIQLEHLHTIKEEEDEEEANL